MSTATVTANGTTITESYLYDWAGTRTAKITDGVLTYYLVDTAGVLSQVLAELDHTGALITHYTRGAELISLSRPSEKRYYIHDGQGSVRALSDADGQVTDTYLFDAFGNFLSKTGTTANDFLYTGEQYDANTGFYYLRARYMNPSTGTFTSMDAYAGTIFDPVSLHKYLYANANPVMNRDPSGYVTYGELLGAMAINAVLGAAIGGLSGLILNVLYYDTHGGDMQSPDRNKVAWEGFWKGALFGAAGGAIFGGLGILGTEFIFANVLSGIILYFQGLNCLGQAAQFYMNGDTLWGDISLAFAGFSFFGSGFCFGKAWSMAFDDFYVPSSASAAGAADEGIGFDSFDNLKDFLGSPGEGNHWHHIVEQSQIQKSGFSSTMIQNTNNVIAVDAATHAKISGYYNSIDAGLSDTMRVRDWLAGQSFETQYQFGMNVLKRFGVTK